MVDFVIWLTYYWFLIIARDVENTNTTTNATELQDTEALQDSNSTQNDEESFEDNLFAPVYAALRRFPNAKITFRLTQNSIPSPENNGTESNP